MLEVVAQSMLRQVLRSAVIEPGVEPVWRNISPPEPLWYPLVMTQSLLLKTSENGPLIVDLPSKDGDFL